MPRAFEHPDDQDEIRYTLRLPRALYEQLRARAGAEGYSLHAAMLQALHGYVRRGRWAGRATAEAARRATGEEER